MALNEGLRGMFRGNWTNCLRIVPNSAIKFLTYEQLTRCSRPPNADLLLELRVGMLTLLLRYITHELQKSKGEEGQMTPLLRLVAGATAGTIAMSATYPLVRSMSSGAWNCNLGLGSHTRCCCTGHGAGSPHCAAGAHWGVQWHRACHPPNRGQGEPQLCCCCCCAALACEQCHRVAEQSCS